MIDTIIEAHKYYVEGRDKFTVFEFLLEKLLKLTGSEYGFIGEILYKDEIPYLRTYAITNIAWTEELKKKHEKFIGIGWDFFSLDTLFGLVITENKIIISNDPKNDPRRGGKIKIPKGHPDLSSFAGIPFYHNKKIIGMVGIANKENGYTEEYIKTFNPFLDTCSILISSYKTQDTNSLIEKKNNTFMSQISHDMRTPLNGIFGYCQLLEMSINEKDKELHTYIKSIKNCGNRLLELIDDILRITKTVVDIKVEELNLSDFLTEMIKMVEPMANKNNIKLINKIGDKFNILVDKKIIGVIFSNILTNAIKYNKNGGSVTLESQIVDKEFINIHISDTGLGISKKELESIFKPFYRATTTSHIEGNGIGLSIVKKYISLLKGQIFVESKVDIGSKFIIQIKYNKLNGEIREKKVLYVEDDITNQSLMKNVMNFYKIPIDVIDTIKGAIEILRDKKYEYYILDLNMPDGNGLELIPHIEDTDKIIILTADASTNTSKDVYEKGIKHFLIKPFSIDELISIIKIKKP